MYAKLTDSQWDALAVGDRVILVSTTRNIAERDPAVVVRRTEHQVVVQRAPHIPEVGVRRFGVGRYLCAWTPEMAALEEQKERARRMRTMLGRATTSLGVFAGHRRAETMPPEVLELLWKATVALEEHDATVDASTRES